MSDFERVLRSLESHFAKTPEEKAYLAGYHAGLDKARWQVVGFAVGVAVGTVLYRLLF